MVLQEQGDTFLPMRKKSILYYCICLRILLYHSPPTQNTYTLIQTHTNHFVWVLESILAIIKKKTVIRELFFSLGMTKQR